jgi:hypothetical protein
VKQNNPYEEKSTYISLTIHIYLQIFLYNYYKRKNSKSNISFYKTLFSTDGVKAWHYTMSY